jgi:hypothetical protein
MVEDCGFDDEKAKAKERLRTILKALCDFFY